MPASTPQVPATEVYFYTHEDYAGGKQAYKVGDDVNLYPGALGDKFRSAAVGSDVKVLAWNHQQHSSSTPSPSSPSGAPFAELTGATTSLASGSGTSSAAALTRFRVVDDDTHAIALRFVAAADADADAEVGEPRYSLKVESADVGEKLLLSEEVDNNNSSSKISGAEKFQLVGTIREDGAPVTTAVYVRDEKTGAYLAAGTVNFKWSAAGGDGDGDGQVDVVEDDDNFPKQLAIERAGPSRFVVTLVSSEPSATITA
ncbi:hypothetical protein SLS62_008461 [Diatrype stigma]|uniref:Abundant perithecial protein n=1 Tax=Diatrype stigma TaxID=117547 RepID=A0AAN9UJM6_9PEZI